MSNVLALFAAVPVGDDPSPTQPLSDGSLVLPISVATMILGSFLPILTALVAKSGASTRLRAVAAIFFTIVATILRRAIDGGTDLALDWALVGEFFQTFAVQVAAYLGFWQPIVDINDRLLPRLGLGKAAA